MKHTELKQGDIVIFRQFCDILEREDYQDGSVISVDNERKKVTVCWLDGYKSRVDDIDFCKVIAKPSHDGEFMKLGVFSGKFFLLEKGELLPKDV